MKKKTITALKKLDKLSPTEKIVATAVGAAMFPIVLTLEVYKQSQKKKYKKRRRK